jgi:hypothetical protein
MGRLSRGKARLAALLAGAPIAVAILVAGQTPASAVTYFSSCPASGYVCFYGGTNWTPWNAGSDIIGLQGTNPNWNAFGDVSADNVCGGVGHTWNDCASSDRNNLGRDMRVWKDVNCQGGVFLLPAGQDYSDLSSHAYSPPGTGNAGNSISSDRLTAGTGC